MAGPNQSMPQMDGQWYQTPQGVPYFVPTQPQQPKPPTQYPWLNQQRPYQLTPVQTEQSLLGRVVTSLDDIKPQEIKMDGSISLFPTSDFQHIYAKQWSSSGTISTIDYIPAPPQPEAPPANPNADVLARLDKLEDFIRQSLTPQELPVAG